MHLIWLGSVHLSVDSCLMVVDGMLLFMVGAHSEYAGMGIAGLLSAMGSG